MHEVLKVIVEQLQMKNQNQKPFDFVRDQPTEDDLNHILQQADSEFDPLQLRKQMLEDLKVGKAQLLCRRGPFAKVLVIVHPENREQIPWKLFAKIFQAFGLPSMPMKSSNPKKQWRVILFAHPSPRRLPSPEEKPGPQHLNGGYAYPNDPSSIVIYRLEECERVLVHELLHAAGTDGDESDSQREALTETWAELFLIAIKAGSQRKAMKLWKIQAQWIADQEAALNLLPTDYGWRYTTGRRTVLEKLGLQLPTPSPNPREALGGSLRFTY